MGIFSVKPVINKRNGQINISLPKKIIPKDIMDDIKAKEKIKLRFEPKKLK